MSRRLLLLSWTWLVLLSLLPLGFVLAIALGRMADHVPPFHFGFETTNFTAVLEDPLYLWALWLSIRTAALVTVICLVMGYPMALAIAGAPSHWRGPLLLAMMLPFWTGFLMRINAWIGLLRDDGWADTVLAALGFAPAHLLYTDTALCIGMVYTYLPFMVLPVYAQLAKLDETLLEAAADLGASPFRAFLRVTLPLSLPGIGAGVALVFIPSAGEYVIPDLLGGPGARLIGRVVWEEFFNNRDWPMAAALTWVLLVALVLVPVAIRAAVNALQSSSFSIRRTRTSRLPTWFA